VSFIVSMFCCMIDTVTLTAPAFYSHHRCAVCVTVSVMQWNIDCMVDTVTFTMLVVVEGQRSRRPLPAHIGVSRELTLNRKIPRQDLESNLRPTDKKSDALSTDHSLGTQCIIHVCIRRIGTSVNVSRTFVRKNHLSKLCQGLAKPSMCS